MADEPKEQPESKGTDDSARIERLSGGNARLRRELEEKTEQLEAALKVTKALTVERDEFKVKADTSVMAKKLAEAEAKLRGKDHEAAFARVAKEKGADLDAINDLYRLSGWEAKTDEIDEEAMGEAVEALKVKPGISRLFVPAEPMNPGKPAPKPGTASGQGKTERASSNDFTSEQLADPVFSMKHWDRIVASAQGKVERGEV